jgi:sugar lactone lactonase YvrE
VRGRTLYVTSGIGDSLLPGPVPGTAIGNPNPSSQIFSSVLAVHLSANAEKIAEGFTLSLDDHEALAAGEKLKLSNGGGDKATVELIANFPDFIPNPLPFFEENVTGSNPFDLVAVGNRLYVTDGGRNLVWQVDIHSGEFSQLAFFPPIPNPLPFGPPVVEGVPTGIALSDGQLLVALLRGAPFPTGASQVQSVDPRTGAQSPFITDLTTAIDVLPIRDGEDTDWLVLQHSSEGPFFGGTGLLLRFESPGGPPTVVADCLELPTSMSLDPKTGTLYVTELGGRIVTFQIAL